MDKVNLKDKLALFSDLWSPKIVGQVGDMHLKLGKIKGEFEWHSHENEDELFYVVQGRMILRFRDKDVVLEPGEFITVPKGVEHMPVAEVETHLLMIEPVGTVNTGDNEGSSRTVEPEWI
ncbi:cupin domain-containing protein [Desulfovibrio ferrophilus]|uniref:Cupin 2 conserved barrel protein n=1 Tax=Desulfovibrio ferrophilus TaxID=241368 RepID=A0A2Z6B2V8_9BACT|nr:cupin domain-containing protein [Desulfovibrio ferrophilus]BBD09849.1 cupin 2 conserved barrel protein [Desulfovibrio ferrophilus]